MTISAENAEVRVIFYGPNTFRIWLTSDGKFSNPANDGSGEDIVVDHDLGETDVEWTENDDYHAFGTENIVVRAYTNPLRFELREADGTQVWSETEGIGWSDAGTVQRLSRGEEEQFFGGGMQNGRFSHRGDTIGISTSSDWNDGGHPNPAPFYMSTKGYGAFRNTYAPGQYSFTEPVKTSHNEQRFDAYYFYGPGLKEILDKYTQVTGRPFLPPIYGLEFGDADCYNDDGENTLPAAVEVAEGYVEHDMPRGWMLVNDGYGCGYTDLPKVVDELLARNIRTGLWTEDGLPNQQQEIEAGVRIRKLDVAWIGQGYEFTMDAAETAHTGIEQYSPARGYVWTVEGWAGMQRYAVMWTGDQSGSYENIQFHIPTIHGSGNSGFAWVSSDVDGIFGGSAETYTRDLQWKVFTPAFLGMSGWAEKDKQPWVYGEPYTSINRTYLRLRERLLPYFYTYAAEAHWQGTPLSRSLVLEYPDDSRTWDDTTLYEFLAGESLLVAPVYEDTETRDDIYLPDDLWVDYWSGNLHQGPRIVNGYPAPLETLPLFVKAGAIIPMWPEGTNNHREVAEDARITLDIYPKGESSFTLYDDDQYTRQFQEGAYAEQPFSVTAPESGSGDVEITVGKSEGDYDGKPAARPYEFTVHTGIEPSGVTWKGEELSNIASESEYANASAGWYYDETDRGGVIYVKTESVPMDASHTATLQGTSAVDGLGETKPPVWVTLNAPERMIPGAESELTTTLVNENSEALSEVDISLTTPDGWTVETTADGETESGGSTTVTDVGPGEMVTITHAVTPSEDAYGTESEFSVEASYELNGDSRTVRDTATVQAPDEPPTTDVWASDLDWESATNGWGPVERDQSVGGNGANDGNPITLNGQTYEKGLGTNAHSEIKYFLGGNFERFTATIGVDDEIPDYGSVVFHVLADGEKEFMSDTLTGTSTAQEIDVSIDGAQFVTLEVTNASDGKTGDHGDWAAARFIAADDDGEDNGIVPIGDNKNAPTDPDGDGLYEDIDGDGKVTDADGEVFFDHIDDPEMQDNVEAFDFNDNGRLDLDDIVEWRKKKDEM